MGFLCWDPRPHCFRWWFRFLRPCCVDRPSQTAARTSHLWQTAPGKVTELTRLRIFIRLCTYMNYIIIYIYMYICLLSTIIILLLSNVESYSQSNHYFQWNVWNMQGGFRLWLMTSHDPCPHQERDVDGRGPRHPEFEARNGYPTHTWDMTPYNVQHIIRLQMFV